MIEKNEMLKMLDVLTNEDFEYATRLEAYEFLLEDCEVIVDEMLERFYKCEGDTAQMLLEIMANYPGHKGVFMALVSYLYRGEDVALFARLLGKYGDLSAIQLLEDFAKENELNYNEYMEIRNAVEELGGVFKNDESKFADDMFYRYVKGLDEEDDDDRKSPFEDILNPPKEQPEDEDSDEDAEECLEDDGCHCHDEECHDDCDCDEDCHCHDNECHDDCDCDEDCHCHDNECHCNEEDAN